MIYETIVPYFPLLFSTNTYWLWCLGIWFWGHDWYLPSVQSLGYYLDVDPQKKNSMDTNKSPNRRKFISVTLPETSSSSRKMVVGRQAFASEFRSIFLGELLVSGSVVFRSVYLIIYLQQGSLPDLPAMGHNHLLWLGHGFPCVLTLFFCLGFGFPSFFSHLFFNGVMGPYLQLVTLGTLFSWASFKTTHPWLTWTMT